MSSSILALAHVDFVRGPRTILTDVTWSVQPSERWVVLGPNGSGKTTLCRLAGLYLHPTRGTVDVLGRRVGQVDIRELRQRIGFTSAAIAGLFRPNITAEEVVVTGKHGALAPYWHRYTDADHGRARHLLERFGCATLHAAAFETLSSGERQRVLLARTLMPKPSLLLLDEPTAGLDLGGREQLVSRLGELAADPTAPAIIMVTHHVDEIPTGFTHALVLRGGAVLASGALTETLTDNTLSRCFDVPLELRRFQGRWSAQAGSTPIV